MKKGGLLALIALFIWCCEQAAPVETTQNYGIENQVIVDNIQDGIHQPTGFIAAEGLESMLRHCVSCHSSKLIIQNRATEEGWRSMIKWMYETQNLPQLGDQEDIIVSYLSNHYAPEDTGRRKSLEIDDWYPLEQ